MFFSTFLSLDGSDDIDRVTYLQAQNLYEREHELLYLVPPEERISQEQKARNRAKFTTSANRVRMLIDELEVMEDEFGIERWTKECEEYKSAMTLINERRYRKALDNLERLMVQRLFELTKLGMSGLGEYPSNLSEKRLTTHPRVQTLRKNREGPSRTG